MLKAFLALNRRLSTRIEGRLPQCRTSIYEEYDRIARTLVDGGPHIVLDVGGGRESHIAQFCSKDSTIIALDISGDELAQNHKATQKVVADACKEFPLRSESVDLVTSYCVLEHLPNVTAFCRHASRVLRPGGAMLHVFPCRYALFSIANRVFPFRASRWLISTLTGKPKTYGFPAYYDQCSPAKIQRALAQAGFYVETTVLNFYQSFWFTFFAPLYSVCVLWELVLMALRLRPLCGHVVVLARKGFQLSPASDATGREHVSSKSNDHLE
jgi:ubiquinone/menaquinone biosynthesis C-methylase UbiE